MANITDCILKLFKDGKIDEHTKMELESHVNDGHDLKTSINKLKQTYTKEAIERTNTYKAFQKELERKLPTYTPAQRIQASLGTLSGHGSKVANIESLTVSLRQAKLSEFAETIEHLRDKTLGADFKIEHLEDALRTLHDGVKRGKEGNEIAKMITTVTDSMDKELGRPHTNKSFITHNTERVQNVSRKEYIEQVKPLTTDSEAKIGETYDNIVDHAGGAEENALAFNSTDNMLKYANKFGSDVYKSFMTTLETDAHKLAIKKIFGSKHNMLKAIEHLDRAGRRKAENMLSELDGSVNHMANHNKATKISKGSREIASLAQLSNTAFTAVSDLTNYMQQARTAGIPFTKSTLSITTALFRKGTTEKFLADETMISEGLMNDLGGAQRYESFSGESLISKLNQKMFKIIGLELWTNAFKNMWKKTYYLHLKTLPKDFDKVTGKSKQLLEEYGIDKEVWASFKEAGGIKGMDKELAHKIRRLINEQANYAIIEPNANVLSFVHQGTQAGTFMGEADRAIAQYKTFPAAQLMTHGARAMQGAWTTKLEYMASYAAFATFNGVGILMMNDALHGNNPFTRDYTKFETFKQVLSKGAGMVVIDLAMNALGSGKLDFATVVGIPSLSFANNLAFKPIHYWANHPGHYSEAFNTFLSGVGKEMPMNNWLLLRPFIELYTEHLLLAIDPGYAIIVAKRKRWEHNQRKKVGLQPFEF